MNNPKNSSWELVFCPNWDCNNKRFLIVKSIWCDSFDKRFCSRHCYMVYLNFFFSCCDQCIVDFLSFIYLIFHIEKKWMWRDFWHGHLWTTLNGTVVTQFVLALPMWTTMIGWEDIQSSQQNGSKISSKNKNIQIEDLIRQLNKSSTLPVIIWLEFQPKLAREYVWYELK